MKYIDAKKMIAELQRQKHELELSIKSQGDYGQSCQIVAYENIIGTFDILSSRERAVIECRYGIGKNAQTLDTIGRDFRLTKERIRQIESSGLRKLRHPSNLKRIYGVD